MSQATHECFETVLDIEQRCQDMRARTGTCDTDQLDAQETAVRITMLDTVMRECAEGQLTEVGYIGYFDAENDLINACVRQAKGVVAAAYAPSPAVPVPAATAACMAASAAYAHKVLHFILERATPVMDRMATRLFEDLDKQGFVRRLATELSVTRARWITGLLQACPQFETLYGRSPESFLRTVQQRSDCVLSKTYVNTAVICLPQVCGNGIVEDPEQCDDGNGNDSDGCHNDCTTGPSAPPP
jgi:cysteine-rich repeat protein